MEHKINTITLPMPFRMGFVNTYLIETVSGCLLIDTGSSYARKQLLGRLERLGCSSCNLKLIFITHGDFDHIGNAAFLRSVFRVKIAMHRDDSGMAERGDMFVNRKRPNIIIRVLLPLFTGFGKNDRFTPDIQVSDRDDLSAFGLDARIIHLPGHSRGSIGVITANGDLFCGDLFENTKVPAMNSLMDDCTAASVSIETLKKSQICFSWTWPTFYNGCAYEQHYRDSLIPTPSEAACAIGGTQLIPPGEGLPTRYPISVPVLIKDGTIIYIFKWPRTGPS